MRAVFAYLFVAIACLSGIADAHSPSFEVNPKSMTILPVAFEIHSKPLGNGDFEFTVKASSRAYQIPTTYHAGLGIVKVTQNSEEHQPIRTLKTERQGDVVTSTFTVTKRELANPDLSFCFEWPAKIDSAVEFYARLKLFIAP